MIETLQYLSIIVEVIIAILGLMIVFQKKKNYGWGIFVTFAIYVFYDFVRISGANISSSTLYGIFFIASVSALATVWTIYSENKTNKKR